MHVNVHSDCYVYDMLLHFLPRVACVSLKDVKMNIHTVPTDVSSFNSFIVSQDMVYVLSFLCIS